MGGSGEGVVSQERGRRLGVAWVWVEVRRGSCAERGGGGLVWRGYGWKWGGGRVPREGAAAWCGVGMGGSGERASCATPLSRKCQESVKKVSRKCQESVEKVEARRWQKVPLSWRNVRVSRTAAGLDASPAPAAVQFSCLCLREGSCVSVREAVSPAKGVMWRGATGECCEGKAVLSVASRGVCCKREGKEKEITCGTLETKKTRGVALLAKV
eukprot:351865-Chlamydomonas_euryale.AAC.5